MDKKLHYKENKNLIKIKNKKVCFLITSGRSGSFFLHSLLDNHPEILSIPILFDSYAFWLENKDLQTVNQFIDKLLKSTNFSLLCEKKNTPESGNFSESKFNTDLFKYHLSNLLYEIPSKPDDLFYLIHLAYALTQNIQLEKINLIIEHAHFYPYRVEEKTLLFPNCLFLHIIRNPKDSFYSYYKRYTQLNNGTFLPEHWLYILESCIYGINDILKYNSETFYKTILLEDLHISPTKTLNYLTEFLEISHHKSLFESTLDGIPYITNSGVHQNISGFSQEITRSKYHQEFTQTDICFIETLTQHLMKLKNYPFESSEFMSKKQLLKYRFKCEKDMNYWGALFYQYPQDISDISQKSAMYQLLNRLFILRFLVYFKIYQKYLKSIRNFWKKRPHIINAALTGKN